MQIHHSFNSCPVETSNNIIGERKHILSEYQSYSIPYNRYHICMLMCQYVLRRLETSCLLYEANTVPWVHS